MRTNAPGSFSCEIYLKAWELGLRGDDTMIHIDNCYFCGPIVHGGTEDFPLSVQEQAKKNIADRKRQSRRRFFRRTAVASSLIGLSALGFNFFRESESVGTTSSVQSELTADFSRFDARYATFGKPKIETIIATRSATQKVRAIEWIQVRGHTGMYDLICQALAERDPNVAMAAYVNLVKIGAAALKPHLQIVYAALRQIKDRDFQNLVTSLATEIESS